MALRWMNDRSRPLSIGVYDDPTTGEVVIVQQEDVEPVLRENRRQFNRADTQRRRSEEWHHWAEVPIGIYHHWKAKYGVDLLNPDHWEEAKKLLHDPAYKDTRVSPGNYMTRPARQHFSQHRRRSLHAAKLIGKSLAEPSGRVRRRGAIG